MGIPSQAVILGAGCGSRMGALTRELPKFLLPVGGRPLVTYALDELERAGVSEACFVVGYRHEAAQQTLGPRHGRLALRYVVSPRYATTGSGLSLSLARELWNQRRGPLAVLHADAFCHPDIIRQVLSSDVEDVTAVDEQYEVRTQDEVVVLGAGGRAQRIVKGLPAKAPQVAGELIGVNRWSAEFTGQFFDFVARYLEAHGPNQNYELPILDAFIGQGLRPLHYLEMNGLPWINVNHPEDYAQLEQVTFPKAYRRAG